MLKDDARLPLGDIWVDLTEKTNKSLSFRMKFSAGMAKFFNSDTFYVEYEDDVSDVSESILYIPVIANIAPVAWATGANVHLKEIDAAFLGALGAIRDVMKRMYPNFSCAGDICAERVVSNRFGHKGSAQLFTGGADSLATYVKHRDEKPELISYRTYSRFNVPLQRSIDGILSAFAQREGVHTHMVESNLIHFLDDQRLVQGYGENFSEASWWASVQHGLGLLGLCAPLTSGLDINIVYIGSTSTGNIIRNPWTPWGSHRFIEGNLSWADVHISYDGWELTRQDKIKVLSRFMSDSGVKLRLIVCNEADRGVSLNCSKCEKCYRTMAGLTLDGIDPNDCGFSMDDRTLVDLKRVLVDKQVRLIHKQPNMWRDMQRSIPDPIASDIHGSKAFFEWFRTMEVLNDRFQERPSNPVLKVLKKLRIK
jgi:hypothetical protein